MLEGWDSDKDEAAQEDILNSQAKASYRLPIGGGGIQGYIDSVQGSRPQDDTEQQETIIESGARVTSDWLEYIRSTNKSEASGLLLKAGAVGAGAAAAVCVTGFLSFGAVPALIIGAPFTLSNIAASAAGLFGGAGGASAAVASAASAASLGAASLAAGWGAARAAMSSMISPDKIAALKQRQEDEERLEKERQQVIDEQEDKILCSMAHEEMNISIEKIARHLSAKKMDENYSNSAKMNVSVDQFSRMIENLSKKDLDEAIILLKKYVSAYDANFEEALAGQMAVGLIHNILSIDNIKYCTESGFIFSKKDGFWIKRQLSTNGYDDPQKLISIIYPASKAKQAEFIDSYVKYGAELGEMPPVIASSTQGADNFHYTEVLISPAKMIKIRTKDAVDKDCNIPNLLQKWTMAQERIDDVLKKIALCFVHNGEEFSPLFFDQERELSDHYASGALAAKELFERYSDIYNEFYNEKEAEQYLGKIIHGILDIGLIYDHPCGEISIIDQIDSYSCDINYSTKVKVNQSLIANKCDNAANIAAFFYPDSPQKQTALILDIINCITQRQDKVSNSENPNYSNHDYSWEHLPDVNPLGDEAKED